MIRRLLAVAAMAVACVAHAQDYPSKPIRIIIPSTPGGGTDYIGRLMGNKLHELNGWSVVPENKPGAGTALGLAEAARAPAQGYDLVIGQSDNVTLIPLLMKVEMCIRDRILAVSLDPNYSGDRVGAFIYGLADTIIAAHNGKTRLYATDALDGQRVYNAARNVEAAAWLLASRRNNQGEPLLLANEMSPQATNLSFEREFGAIIGRLDLIANLLGENSRRIGINYAQGLLLFNFLPVR